MIDVGGTSVKLMASGHAESRKFASGRKLSAAKMVKGVLAAVGDWEYDAVSLGFPGLVREGRIARDPLNLSAGWMRFDFAKALKRPVRIINDASLQALAHYDSGRLLFLGLGTSVGAALVADDTIVPLEIGILRFSKTEAFMDRLGKKALLRLGKRRWQKSVMRVVDLLRDVFWPDHIILGGGNARRVDPLPKLCQRAGNEDAFRGAIRLWPGADMLAEPVITTWRIARHPAKRRAFP